MKWSDLQRENPEDPLSDEWLQKLGGKFRPNNGWMFGPNDEAMFWKVGGGWGFILGSMEPDESIPIATKGHVIGILFGLRFITLDKPNDQIVPSSPWPKPDGHGGIGQPDGPFTNPHDGA